MSLQILSRSRLPILLTLVKRQGPCLSRAAVSHKTPQGPSEEPETSVNMELTYKKTDYVSFDPKFILQEPEEERKSFQDYVKTYGELRFARPAPDYPERDFVASADPEEWKFVERLMPKDLIPAIPKKEVYPSGFKPPTAKLNDYPYHVSRTKNNLLAVYAEIRRFGRKKNFIYMWTTVRKADGNLFKLRDDICDFLEERYHTEFVTQVAEVYGAVNIKGDYETDIKEFLLQKGF